jgi:hypothetical protein
LTCPCHHVVEKLKEEKSKYEQSFSSLLNQKMLTCKTNILTKRVCIDVNCKIQKFCSRGTPCITRKVCQKQCKIVFDKYSGFSLKQEMIEDSKTLEDLDEMDGE